LSALERDVPVVRARYGVPDVGRASARLRQGGDRPMAALMRPRIGFLGLGWIGQARLRALIDADVVEGAVVADPRRESAMRVATDLPDVRVCASMEDLLEERLDGVVIATPSALHANQVIACLKHGMAVFCQKPLARSAEEARRVIQVARAVDRR